MTSPMQLTVNGQVRPVAEAGPHTTTLDWLRSTGLTGAKEGCAEGECGACSVLVLRPAGDGSSRWTALNSCLVPVWALDGQEIVTAEGLGSPDDLHPVQREMAVRGGSQCGYCTPGFVCSMAAEFYRRDRDAGRAPAEDEQDCGPNGFDLHAMSGNLCRCTGYRPIRDAAYALGAPAEDDALLLRTAEPAPPPTLTSTGNGQGGFSRPADLSTALRLLAEHPEAVLLAGSTDVGVEVNIRHRRPARIIAIDHLPELRELRVDAEHVEIGAALSLSEVERDLDGAVPLLDQLIPQFASRLIRNGATIGGNLATASPIGDAAPVLLALDASVLLVSGDGEREVPLTDFFTGYRETVQGPGELIRAVRVPLPMLPDARFYKMAKRRFDDISSVAVAVAARFDGERVAQIRIGLGGVAATPVRALATEQELRGARWTEDGVTAAAQVLAAEGTPMDDHRASAAYRRAMLAQSLLRFHAETAGRVEEARR